jgi:hypothetical protein
MREVAKYMRQLRSISNEFQSQFSDELKMLDEMNPRRIINDVIDPNATSTSAKTTAAKTAATAKTSTTTPAKPLAAKPPAKSPATEPPNASAATIGTAAAGATAGSAAIVNGESPNTILPPANGEAAPQGSGSLAVPDLPAPGAPPPAEVDLAAERFVDASSDLSAQNGANGVHPQDTGVEAAQ